MNGTIHLVIILECNCRYKHFNVPIKYQRKCTIVHTKPI